MLIEITVDGESVEHDVDLDIDRLTLKQSVKLEKVMGPDRCAKMLGGDESIAALPTSIQAIIYVQLADQFPGLKLGDFDFDLNELFDVVADEPTAEVVPLSMTLADGSEVEGASAHVDPTTAPAETG